MSKAIPPVSKYMTDAPHTVGKDQTLVMAHKLMQQHHIRHLPVLEGGQLVGMLTQRDLHLIETLRDVVPETMTVEEAMSTEVYKVRPDAPLDEVVQEMASHKYGSAVVVDNHHVVGVMTTVDVCRALAELLSTRLAK